MEKGYIEWIQGQEKADRMIEWLRNENKNNDEQKLSIAG